MTSFGQRGDSDWSVVIATRIIPVGRSDLCRVGEVYNATQVELVHYTDLYKAHMYLSI